MHYRDNSRRGHFWTPMGGQFSAPIDILKMADVTISGMLDMSSLRVRQHLEMTDARFAKSVRLIFARIGANLDLSNSDLGELDLSGTRVIGELTLGSAHARRTRWREGAGLNLRNAHVGALQDRRDRLPDPESGHERWEDAWPAELQLNGFTYDRLGGFGGTAPGDTGGDVCDVEMLGRDIDWYLGWLARDSSYTPQPYEQLAVAFRAAGEPTKANRVLYASRERERTEALERGHGPRWTGLARWTGLSLLKWTIGYGLGLGYFRALLWLIAFTAIGTAILSGNYPVSKPIAV